MTRQDRKYALPRSCTTRFAWPGAPAQVLRPGAHTLTLRPGTPAAAAVARYLLLVARAPGGCATAARQLRERRHAYYVGNGRMQ